MRDEKNVICNQCGKNLRTENGIAKEGVFSVHYPFGYFSEKDGQVYDFDLCEECFDAMIRQFKIPCQIFEATELI